MRFLQGAVAAWLLSASPALADPPLYATVATKASRTELSQFLVHDAEAAVKARDWAHAIPLYEALVVARGEASPEQQQLATLWTLAGQNTDAASAWDVLARATTDDDVRRKATAEATRLRTAPDPFADKLVLAVLPTQAKRAFALGRAAVSRKDYGDALVYLHVGYALAPDLPGFLRELGAVYDKLGEPDRKRDFYRRYLVERPLGSNADVLRRELAKDPGALGTLFVSSSLPCGELWLNRERVTGKFPDAGLAVAPGEYKGLCFTPKYEMALFEYATVEAGHSATLAFRWAIVVNALEHPLGRIAVENPKAPGMMIDLGITSPEIGVAVPGDGKKLKMRVEDDTGTRREQREVAAAPGQRIVIQW
jgi:tetratricopeptide (TPR) repeat protein